VDIAFKGLDRFTPNPRQLGQHTEISDQTRLAEQGNGTLSMKILMLHNFYQQPGGEDESFAAEAEVLERHGHEVIRYTRHNDAIKDLNPVSVGLRTIWNQDSYRELQSLIRIHRPDLVHAQNVFPLISPAAYHVAAGAGIPVVQSVRNYRMFCLNAQFFRDGQPCEDCLGRTLPVPGIRHACYRGSRVQSSGVAAMQVVHRALGTWRRHVSLFIALSEFTRRKCIESGLPEAKVVTKPNFLKDDPGAGPGDGGYALYIGRLSPEKGIGTMLNAWQRLGETAPPLKVVGDGPLAGQVQAATGGRVEWLGRRSSAEVLELLRHAAFLVFPSEWYETFGRVAIEAFALGTPVVAARIGAVAELVDDGRTGLHFTPGDAADLADKVRRMAVQGDEWRRMRMAARAEFEARFTPEANYRQLIRIYHQALGPMDGFEQPAFQQ
jgi:glycosyltransferase involved in cell wall biosynthesis